MIKKIFTAFLFVLLVACSNQNSEDLENIEQAFDNNQNLESGTFESVSLEESDGELLESKIRGSFINDEGGDSTWYVFNHYNTSNEEDYMERAKIDGKIYNQFVLDDEEAQWQEVANPGVAATLYEMEPLINYEELDHVDTVETEEIAGLTHYIVTFTKERSDRIVEDTVEDMEEAVEREKEKGITDEVIELMEMNIEEMKGTVFSDMINTYVVDQEGQLVEVHYESVVTRPDGVPISFRSSTILTDYNLENTDGLIPTI